MTLLGVLSVPTFANDVAARITFATGQVYVLDSANKKQTVVKGDLIRSGDKIETANGRVQIRMTDGGIIVLRPYSLFEISQYSFNKATPESGSVLFNFIRGGARAISGAIGRTNRLNYQFKTPVATIGIRGTDYSTLIRDNETLVTVNQGAVELSNNNGNATVIEGTTYTVSTNNKPELCHEEIEHKTGDTTLKQQINKPCSPAIVPLETEDGVYLSKEKVKKPLLENFSSYGAYAEALRKYQQLEEEFVLSGGKLNQDSSFTVGLVEDNTPPRSVNTGIFDNKETLDANELRDASVLISQQENLETRHYIPLNTPSLAPSELREQSIVSAIGIQPDSPPSLLQLIEFKYIVQNKVFSLKLSSDTLSANPHLFGDDELKNDIQRILESYLNVNTQNFLGNNTSVIGADFGTPDIDVELTASNNGVGQIISSLAPALRTQDYLVGRGVLSPETLAQLDSNNNKIFRGFSFKQGLIHDNDGIVGNRNSGSLMIGNGSLEQSTVVFTDDTTPISVNLTLGRGIQANTVDQTALDIKVNTPKLAIKLGDIYVSNSDSSAANINKDGGLDLGSPAILGSNDDGGPAVNIMGPAEIVLGAATIDAKLQHHSQAKGTVRSIDGLNVIPTVTILADAFIREGLAINHVDMKDVGGSIKGGSLMIDNITITDYNSPNLTAKLAVNIEERGKGTNASIGGLLLTLKQLGDAMNGIDIALNNVSVGSTHAADIGDVQLIGLNLNGASIILRGH